MNRNRKIIWCLIVLFIVLYINFVYTKTTECVLNGVLVYVRGSSCEDAQDDFSSKVSEGLADIEDDMEKDGWRTCYNEWGHYHTWCECDERSGLDFGSCMSREEWEKYLEELEKA